MRAVRGQKKRHPKVPFSCEPPQGRSGAHQTVVAFLMASAAWVAAALKLVCAVSMAREKQGTGKRLTAEERKKLAKQREKEMRKKKRDQRK